MFDTNEKEHDVREHEDAHSDSLANTPQEIRDEIKNSRKKNEHPFFELIKVVLIAVIIVAPIRFYIAQPFVVSGASMKDTFEDGQYLIVDQLSYRVSEPERGDVVIFRFPLEPSKFFIKRIIGLPNETVTVEGHEVVIVNTEHPDGTVLTEPYVSPARSRDDFVSVTLHEGEYFVMGDNRKESSDSRTWGVLNEEYIVGRAFIRLFPITELDVFPGQDQERVDANE